MTSVAVTSCPECGWPRAQGAGACPSCGSTSTAAAGQTRAITLAGPQPEDFPELDAAFVAFRNKDVPRMVLTCLQAVGVRQPVNARTPLGPMWAFAQDSAAIYIYFEQQTQTVVVEAPLVEVAAEMEAPLLRALLELNARALGASRFCRRGPSLVVLTWTESAEACAPPKLVGAIREVAILADRFDNMLSTAFGARMVGPDAQLRGLQPAVLGEPRKLKTIKPAAHISAVSATYGAGAQAASRSGEGAPAITGGGTDIDALLAMLREVGEGLRALEFVKGSDIAQALLIRGVLFRASSRCRATCAATCDAMLEEGRPFYAQTNVVGLEAQVLGMRTFLGRVVQARGDVKPRGAAPVVAPLAIADAKRLATAALLEGDAMRLLPVKRALLLGILAEISVRAQLAPAASQAIKQQLDAAEHAPASADGVNAVRTLLQRIAA